MSNIRFNQKGGSGAWWGKRGESGERGKRGERGAVILGYCCHALDGWLLRPLKFEKILIFFVLLSFFQKKVRNFFILYLVFKKG